MSTVEKMTRPRLAAPGGWEGVRAGGRGAARCVRSRAFWSCAADPGAARGVCAARAGRSTGGEKDEFDFDDDAIWGGEEPSRLSGKATMHRNHGKDAGRFARRAARGRIGRIAKRQKCYLHSCRAPAAKVRDDQA